MMTTKDFKVKILPLSQRIYPMAARMLNNEEEAKDAVQEIMIKLWNYRKKLNQHPNINGFIFLTAKNYCLDRMKAQKMPLANIDQALVADFFIDQSQSELEDLFIEVRQIVADLPENQKEVILMRDIDGLEFDEITAVTNLKLEHIRVLLSRARKYVRIQLKKIYGYE